MSTYLLLRDNKENGPLTFEEIKAKGLKAYDLVWVEGKSAAWRYPGEIEELKPFSPEVVEQPFDRFFKRPSQLNTPSQENIPAGQQETVVTDNEISVITYRQASTQTGKRNVYVTMPATSKSASQITRDVPAENNSKDIVPTKQLLTAETIFPTESSAPANEIKQPSWNHATRNAAYESTAIKNPAQQADLKKPWMIAAATLLLLGGGILIGMMIAKPRSISPASTLQGKDLSSALPASTMLQTAAVPVSSTDQHLPEQSQPAGSTVKLDRPVTEHSPVSQNPGKVTGQQQTVAFRAKARKALRVSSDQPVKTDTGIGITTSTAIVQVQHREATHRTDANTNKAEVASPLSSLVSTSTNKYTVGAFGGISDLQVTVTNHSSHPLDLVVMEVQYVQANKKVFKTENLYFKNISAGAALMQEAPKSPRGIKVQYRITLINSKDPGITYSGIQ